MRVSRRYLHYGVVTVVLAVLSLVMTWPLAAGLGDHVLGAPVPGDNLQYVWLLRRLTDNLFGNVPLSQALFAPDVFYPFGYNLALSETTLSNNLVGLPLASLWGEVAGYNLLILLSFVLSGLGAYLLALSYLHDRRAALLAGTIYAFAPYRLSHMGAGHLPLMGTQWLPLVWLYLTKMVRQPNVRHAALAGLFYALGALSSWYYAYIWALAGIVFVLLLARPWRKVLAPRPFWRQVLVFGVVVLVLVGPVAWMTAQGWREGQRPTSLRYVDQFSASPLDMVFPSVLNPIWGTALFQAYPQNLHENLIFLGWVPLGLAVYALMGKPTKKWMALAGVGVVFSILALGTTLHWMNKPVYLGVPVWLERLFTMAMAVLTQRLALVPVSSYSLRVEGHIYLPLPTLLLYLYLPLFSGMRVWTRMAQVSLLGVAALAALGFHRLSSRLTTRRWVALVIAVGLVVLEFAAWPYAMGFTKVEARPVDLWLADQSTDGAVMEFPLSKALSGRALYASLSHGKRIASGYGTLFPAAFNEKRGILDTFPTAECLDLLRQWGVKYLLVGEHTYGSDWPAIERALQGAAGVHFCQSFDDEQVYSGDRLLKLSPLMEQAGVVDRIHVYELE